MTFLLLAFSVLSQNCIFNVEGKNIDVSYLNIAQKNYHYSDTVWGDYTFHLCGDLLDEPNLPECVKNSVGWAGAAITDGKCYQTAATDSYQVSKLSENNFTVTYGSDTDSEPTSVDQIKTIHLFECAAGSPSPDPIHVNVDDVNKNRVITLTYQIKCNFVPATPSPTPSVDTTFLKKSTTQDGLGILFNLTEMNGIDRELSYDVKNYRFVFSPGQFIPCPYPYNCQHETQSSLYVCHTGKIMNDANIVSEDKGYCTSFGYPNSNMKFSQDGISENEGVKVRYTDSSNKKTADIYFKCKDDPSQSYHDIKLEGKPNGDDTHLAFTVSTRDTCLRAATPVPDPLHHYCEYQPSGYSSPIFDLFSFNQATVSGINGALVDDESGKVIEDHLTFYIQPCGSIGCPAGFTCVTNEDQSSFWKCSTTTYKCTSIANVTTGGLEFENDKELVGKFGSSLFGKKNAEMHYLCDSNAKSLVIDRNIKYNKNNDVYKIRMTNEAFCLNGDSDSKNSLSGGAIFLIILLVVVVVYIAAGMIILYVRNGIIEFPNTGFWIEFGLCIKEACIYIFTCNGKGTDNLMKSTYDKI